MGDAKGLDECDPLSRRAYVSGQWGTLTDSERAVICRSCASYFPWTESGEFDCLSGHKQPAIWRNPCESYTKACFRLVDDWEYTPRQVYLLRRFEDDCKRCFSGDDGLDDD